MWAENTLNVQHLVHVNNVNFTLFPRNNPDSFRAYKSKPIKIFYNADIVKKINSINQTNFLNPIDIIVFL